MIIARTINELNKYLKSSQENGLKIGFVPTMGALHQGHISLISAAKQATDFVICSIFVNPTQFNDKNDLINYPRTEAQDIKLLQHNFCDLVFIPETSEIYPQNLVLPSFDFENLALVMEGKMRPGHFNGMSQVVYRLLDIVKPTILFMGQKDLQQFTIVQAMLNQMKSEIKLTYCPIIREKDGLAMSSRNVRLLPSERLISPIIFQLLQALLETNYQIKFSSPEQYKNWAITQFNSKKEITVDYVEIVDLKSLKSLDYWAPTNTMACCIAIRIGAVRLIDNVIF